jgi:CRP-like cAMP-binding protein
MKKVRELARGASFGELALATEGAKRSATVKCMTDCEFTTLNKESFKRSM